MLQPADPADPDVALVLGAYESFVRGDVDAAVAGLHPDVEWTEPAELPGGGTYRGPDEVAAYLRGSLAPWATLASERTPYRRGGEVVVVHSVTGVLRDGTAQDVTVADVFTVRDGAVVRMQAYADPADVLGT